MATLVVEPTAPAGVVRDRGLVPTAAPVSAAIRGTTLPYPVLGMDVDDPLPIDVTQITPEMVVAEIVMKREITPMLEAARARGCRIVLGRGMLQEQMPLYLDFFGLTPPHSPERTP